MSKNEIGVTMESQSSSAHNFPIVGIGASAGGRNAFKEMLEAIPVDSNMAYVVVQHLNPEQESNLTEILTLLTPGIAIQKKEKLSEY
jgi:two-component system CheB/CheR fusion protein